MVQLIFTRDSLINLQTKDDSLKELFDSVVDNTDRLKIGIVYKMVYL